MRKSNPSSLCEKSIQKALRHLRREDKVMAELLKKHPACPLGSSTYLPFHTLASSIISQQLSSKAASTIKQRISAHMPLPFEAAAFLLVSPEVLREAGLSRPKARYIREIATRVTIGQVDLDGLTERSDEEAISVLVELPGIGRWTAEMFLIFALKRPNVLALGDAGLKRAARNLYGISNDPEDNLVRAAEAWHPYRSVASWYLWRHADAGF
ncbi:DNA-3-methyladenine glycosylase [soil metagenome]